MLSLKTPKEVMLEIAERAKACRLALNFTQVGLAKRANVSLGSLKRFERSGQVALESLLNIALVLENLETFEQVFTYQRPKITLDEILKQKPIRRRGRRK